MAAARMSRLCTPCTPLAHDLMRSGRLARDTGALHYPMPCPFLTPSPLPSPPAPAPLFSPQPPWVRKHRQATALAATTSSVLSRPYPSPLMPRLPPVPTHPPSTPLAPHPPATADAQARAGRYTGSYSLGAGGAFIGNGSYAACALSAPLAHDLMRSGRLARDADALHGFCVELSGALAETESIDAALEVGSGWL